MSFNNATEGIVAGIFSLLANLCLLVVIFMYLRQVVKSESTPNPATWLIWLVVTVMNTISYYHVVVGDLVRWMMTFTSTIGLGSVFAYALFKGRFGKLGSTEELILIFATLVGIIWQVTGNAVVANVLLQLIFLISFVPTVIGLVQGQLRERTPPWDLVVVAYMFMILSIVSSWQEGSWLALIHPIINGVVGNGSVALTIRLTRSLPST